MMFAGMAQAQQYDFKDGQLFYKITDAANKTVSVVSELVLAMGQNDTYTTYPAGDIVIPSTVAHSGVSYSVTKIDDNAFYKCSSVTSVTIPTSVSSIGNWAFTRCSNMSSITIPSSVTTMGISTFKESGLKSITIPGSIKKVPNQALQNCTALTSVTLSEGIEDISYWAFQNTALESVTLPASLKEISGDGSPFANCIKLKEFRLASGNTSFQVKEGVLFSADGETIIRYPNAKGSVYNIPDGVTLFRSYVFHGCADLTSVSIPASVNYGTDNRVFEDCPNLTSLIVYATTPYNPGPMFEGIDYNKCTLYVPDASVNLYKEHTRWSQFVNIKGISEINTYSLWVAGVQVNEINASDITGTGITGKVSYVPDTKTLTLDNATIIGYKKEEDKGGYNICGIKSEADLNVVLKGINNIQFGGLFDNSEMSATGIECTAENLNISGSGMLNINLFATNNDQYGNYSIVGKNITIKQAKLNFDGKDHGLWSTATLSIQENASIESQNLNQALNGYTISIYSDAILKEGESKTTAVEVSELSIETHTNGFKRTTAKYISISPAGTGLKSLTSQGIKVWGGKGTITIDPQTVGGNMNQTAQIYNVSGALVRSIALSGERTSILSVNAGIYIVKIGNAAEKVVVW